jgi:hypothetical protein
MNLTLNSLEHQEYPLLLLSNGEEVVFSIEKDGTILYTLNGCLKKMESEKELAMILAITISGLSGVPLDKDEIITRIVKNYRDGKLSNLLS